MTGLKRLQAGPHNQYYWGESCSGWRLHIDSALGVTEEYMPPGSHEVPHRHAHCQQLFYLLAGQLELRSEQDHVLLQPGQACHIAAGLAHQVHNPGPAGCRFLVVSQPAVAQDREELPDGSVCAK